MRQFNSTTHFASASVHREAAALDALENQFFERCQRNSANVVYPRHVPVPCRTTNLQRRGLTYQSTTGISKSVPLPVLDHAFSLPLTTCPISDQPRLPSSFLNPVVVKQATHSILYPQTIRNSMTHDPTASRQRRQATRQELNTVHRQNLQRRLHQRMEVARANGNEELLHQLEKEMNLTA